MLDVAFESWIKTLDERDFDETFVALLRAAGFYDVHFTHGAYEFGKDFIAKHPGPPVTQYAFQCKAGDIGGSEWDRLFAQLYQLSSTTLTHPGFDASLPRTFVLVTTGQLTGKAPLCAKDFKDKLADQGTGRFDVWDGSRLRDLLHGTQPDQLPPSPELLPVLGRVASGALEDRDLEALLARLLPSTSCSDSELHRAILDTELAASAMRGRGLPFHALTCSLNTVRITLARAHTHPDDAPLIVEALSALRRAGAKDLAPFLDNPEDTQTWLRLAGGVTGRILAYPAICLRVMETVGLAILSSSEPRPDLVDILSRIVRAQPGCSRPISDRYAVSLPPAVIALARHGHQEAAARLLTRTATWLCDRYQQSEFGLADAHAEAKIEAAVLLGAPFECVALSERHDSLLAATLADLAYYFAPEVYPLIANDLLAVGVVATQVVPHDTTDGYRIGPGATTPLVNINYPEQVLDSPLPHHARSSPRVAEVLRVPEALLAIACLTRDRLFSDCFPALARAVPE